MKIEALDIARRIVSRLRQSKSLGYASGPFHNGDDGATANFTASDGRLYRAYVTPVSEDHQRPLGFDHIIGERPRIDALRLADMLSGSLGNMVRISSSEEDVDALDPWHKDGVAGFHLRSTDGDRYVVEIREIGFDEQLDEARRAVGPANQDISASS